jgi:aspartyl-tRNA(Asn)/glutamyl-tRNA(Gln) amidotransferase subunit B
MEEGSLRADVNISLRPKGAFTLGTKVEIKNMNSLRNIQRAIEYECRRQEEALLKGEKLIQETRTFDAHTGKTHSMRVKETMNDYRYFPEPDLAPLEISDQWLSDIKAMMPTLPWEQERKFIEQYNLPTYDAHFLAETREMALYFEEVASHTHAHKAVANWLMGPIKSHLNDKGLTITEFEIQARQLAEIVELVEKGTITHNLAVHKLFVLCLESPTKSPSQIVSEQGWLNQDVSDELPIFVEAALAAFPDKIKEYHQGKKGLLALFVGEVMKRSKGTADPKRVNQLVNLALENHK